MTRQYCFFPASIAIFFFACVAVVLSQSISNGSFLGTVTDPTGAVIAGAQVTFENAGTGQKVTVKTNDSGTYNSGPLAPGDYTVRVQKQGFSVLEEHVNVLVGVASTGNFRMQLGGANQIVEVQSTNAEVNTEQAEVSGVLSGEQMEALPVNGRNFLDFAQLEPGVQIQDGTNFDPTKVGFSSISFGGRFGRTARISVDGVDVSDETVGTTTTEIPASAISQFQLAQSDLDLSNDLTSSGAVNVSTRSGTNKFHGELFDLFRDNSALSAQLPTPPGVNAPFQRSQFGGRIGGPLIKDKLFWFIDGERTLQNLQAPVTLPDPFQSLSGTFNSPYRETNILAKVDYQLTKTAHLFYRFSYFDNDAFNTFFAASYQVYQNKDITRNQVVGLDWNNGTFTHSIRFSYLKFQNQIVDGSAGQPLNTGLSIHVPGLSVGPNYLAPQSTPQSDHQIKYDGAKTLGNHILRYGVDYNHIQGGGYAAFFSLSPAVYTAAYDPTICGSCPGGANNPTNYPVSVVVMGNGQGYSTTAKAFGFPAGGLGPDNRIGLYFGDNWKLKPNVTITAGLRYDRDTGRTDSDLPGIPELNSLLPQYPNLGAPVRNPNLNFAPQLGFAWDPWKNGKTSIRGGIGLFFENTIWNSVLFDRPTRLAQGAFLQTPLACLAPDVVGPPLKVPDGSIPIDPSLCSGTVGSAEAGLLALEKQYAAASPFEVTSNPGYLPNVLAAGQGPGYAGAATFYPNFQTPRSLQINIGFQRELHPGLVLSADYIRNVTTHTLLGQDLNHTGDEHYFNMNGALQAISNTLTANAPMCMPGGGVTQAKASAAVGCYIANVPTASINDFAGNGLTSTTDLGSVMSCPTAGCAFGGINPRIEQADFLMPIGRSVYNGLQMKLAENVKNPMKGIRYINFQIAYSLSRFENMGGWAGSTPAQNALQNSDQDFILQAADNINPLRYMGPSLLDRTNQISFGGYVQVPAGFQIGIVSHFYSPLSLPMIVSNTGLGYGEIFRTDFTGDGTTADPLPGTNNGAFMRSVGPGCLNNVINNYNSIYAGQPTPAGNTLVQNGLMTVAQLQALGAVAPALANAPAGQVGLAWLHAFDLSFRWSHTFAERITVEPSISFFNVFNFANFDLPPNTLSPYMNEVAPNNSYLYSGWSLSNPSAINGTTYNQQQSVRVGVGTGVFGLGAPRATEFGLRVTW